MRTSHKNWTAGVTFNALSNYGEAANLALEARRMCQKRELAPGLEFWVFTDTATMAESSFFLGHSLSPHLRETGLELRKLEMMEGILITT